MINHIVMFQLQTDIDPDTRLSIMQSFKQSIESLPHDISCIRNIHVGFNCNPAEKWDICLTSLFDTMIDVQTYSQHPKHQAAATAIRPYVTQRACVDYEDEKD